MKVSNEAEVSEAKIVSNMSVQLGSDVLKDTSDMARTGLKNWEPLLQKAVQELISEFTYFLSQDDLDLGRTSIVKHSIKVNDLFHSKNRIGAFCLECMKR